MDQHTTPVIDDLFLAFASASPDIIHLNDMKGNIIYTNQASEELLGYHLSELLQKPAAILIHPDDLPRIGADMQSISANYSPPAREIRLLKKDGSWLNVEVHGFFVSSQQGNFLGATIRDITARKKLEQQRIQFTDTVLTSHLETTLAGILVIAPDQTTLISNKRFQKMWGLSPQATDPYHDALQNKTILDKLKDPDAFSTNVQYLYEHPDKHHTDTIHLKDSRIFEYHSAPLYDINEKRLGRIWYFRDISQVKQQETERLKIKKLESIGILAGGIAHDFNNLLTAILGNIESSSQHVPRQNRATPLLKHAEEACLHARSLTMQLITFAKGGAPVKEIVQLSKIIKDCCNFSLNGSNVDYHFTMTNNMWQVECDTAQLNQVIRNLIINARQAMPEGGTIEVTCDNIQHPGTEYLIAGDYVRISIQDHGTGISDKILPKIFDPYFSTKDVSADKGRGLGLAIVYSIINKHKGHIKIESQEERGATVTIFLPAYRFENIQCDKNPASLPQTARKCKVLVMDDEEMVRNVMKVLLETLGHEVIMAEDGLQAVNLYRELQNHSHPVDLVIMDLAIPAGMGGKETAEQLLQLDPHARLIVASGYSNDPVMANYKEHGFKAAVAKPFILDELELVINKSLT